MPRRKRQGNPTTLTPALLRRWPLPVAAEGEKERRGTVLVVGGSAAIPGAVILAATAALRAGAGKLQIATARSVRSQVAVAVPEACVFALPETSTGEISSRAAREIADRAAEVDALLVGPGMMGDLSDLMAALSSKLRDGPVVLDAEAMMFLGDHPKALHALGGRLVLTPHAGEFASLVGVDKSHVRRHPEKLAREAASAFRAVIALKGAETRIVSPTGERYRNLAGNGGLATSGSGDVLAGIITGLLARGCDPLRATVWGVYLHATAGELLARQLGPIGFLARELLVFIPEMMERLRGKRRPRSR